jgi:tetratricopeptide (TPR) repeat protein
VRDEPGAPARRSAKRGIQPAHARLYVKTFLLLCGLAVLSACAGVGIVGTSDPLAKLNDSEDLFMRQARPLPAERLIREAMAIYEQRGDAHGLANANRQYGDLLRSPAVLKWEKVYRRDGFQDRSITFDNRLEKANDFYRKALTYYERAEQEHRRTQKFDALTNVYFNMAWSHLNLKENENACGYYDKTIEAYQENARRNPDAKPYIPRGSASFPDLIAHAKQRAGCR